MTTIASKSSVVRRLALIFGLLLILTSLILAGFFHLVLHPAITAHFPEFHENRSSLALWRDLERALHLADFWTHDTAWSVGQNGDKTWVEPLIKIVAKGEGIGCFGNHRDLALAYLTNHAPPDESQISAFWIQWWATHQHQAREEWIAQGFATAGVSVQLPPNSQDWSSLLAILSQAPPDKAAGEFLSVQKSESRIIQPEFLRYNAYRWLRDSGFDPVRYTLEASHPLPDAQRQGLLSYRDFETRWRTAIPGRLAFAPQNDLGTGLPMSKMPFALTPQGRLLTIVVPAAITSIGALLIWWSRRHPTFQTEALSTPTDQTTS